MKQPNILLKKGVRLVNIIFSSRGSQDLQQVFHSVVYVPAQIRPAGVHAPETGDGIQQPDGKLQHVSRRKLPSKLTLLLAFFKTVINNGEKGELAIVVDTVVGKQHDRVEGSDKLSSFA